MGLIRYARSYASDCCRLTAELPWREAMREPINNGQIAFYATVATAIPVLLIGYVAGAAKFTKRGVEVALKLVFLQTTDVVLRIFRQVPTISDYGEARTTMMGGWMLLWLGVFGTISTLSCAAAILLLLLGGPAVGEYFALHALVSNHATAEATMWATVGLVATAAAVLIPPAFTVIALPVAALVKEITKRSDPPIGPPDWGIKAPN